MLLLLSSLALAQDLALSEDGRVAAASGLGIWDLERSLRLYPLPRQARVSLSPDGAWAYVWTPERPGSLVELSSGAERSVEAALGAVLSPDALLRLTQEGRRCTLVAHPLAGGEPRVALSLRACDGLTAPLLWSDGALSLQIQRGEQTLSLRWTPGARPRPSPLPPSPPTLRLERLPGGRVLLLDAQGHELNELPNLQDPRHLPYPLPSSAAEGASAPRLECLMALLGRSPGDTELLALSAAWGEPQRKGSEALTLDWGLGFALSAPDGRFVELAIDPSAYKAPLPWDPADPDLGWVQAVGGERRYVWGGWTLAFDVQGRVWVRGLPPPLPVPEGCW